MEIMKTAGNFYNGANRVMSSFEIFANKFNLGEILTADHIGYRCANAGSFEDVRRIFEAEDASKWIRQRILSGRRVALIEPCQELRTPLGIISLIELSDHKPGTLSFEGFDHIEARPRSLGKYDEVVEHFTGKGLSVVEAVRPYHSYHDIKVEGGFFLRLTREFMRDIVRREMFGS